MTKLSTFLTGATLAVLPLLPGMAQAHFQLLYTQHTQIERPGDVPVGLIFWHPFEAGHAMDMGRPEQFFVQSHGQRIDLMDTLTERSFTAAGNRARAWQGAVPVRKMGDYVIAIVPAPYYEASEDIYIQQIAKSFLNRGTLPSDWDAALGLPTEIVPLVRPTNIPTGASFTGRLLSEGAPVADTEIEIEYIAAAPDLDSFAATEPTVAPVPGGALVVKTDANGYFTYALPRAGYWGFAALGSGPAQSHGGKDLSQDAVIWVRVVDMN